jgi:two-component system, response regulator
MNRTGQFILLVDDNPDDVEMTLMAFRKSNIVNEVVVVNDGQEALDYLLGTGAWEGRNCLAMPKIILLDLNLPKVSGLEVLRRMRAEDKTKLLPVVILTTSSEDNDLVSSYDLGANSYVRKPVEFEQFVEAVRQLGLYWLLVNERPPSPDGRFQAAARRNPNDD